VALAEIKGELTVAEFSEAVRNPSKLDHAMEDAFT
jgi:hypothetical protein